MQESVSFEGTVASGDLQTALSDAPTPRPQAGEWTLVAPDGRTWKADSPLKACAAESRERVPADVALARIYRAADEPTELEKKLLAALNKIVRTPAMPFPDAGAHSQAAFTEAVWRAWSSMNQTAMFALAEAKAASA